MCCISVAVLMVLFFLGVARPPALLWYAKTAAERIVSIIAYILIALIQIISTFGIVTKDMKVVQLGHQIYIIPTIVIILWLQWFDMRVTERTKFSIVTRKDNIWFYNIILMQTVTTWVCTWGLSVYTYPAVILSQVLFLFLVGLYRVVDPPNQLILRPIHFVYKV